MTLDMEGPYKSAQFQGLHETSELFTSCVLMNLCQLSGSIYFYSCVLYVSVCLPHVYKGPWEPKEGDRSPLELELQGVLSHLTRMLKLNSYPLGEP